MGEPALKVQSRRVLNFTVRWSDASCPARSRAVTISTPEVATPGEGAMPSLAGERVQVASGPEAGVHATEVEPLVSTRRAEICSSPTRSVARTRAVRVASSRP